MAGVEFAEPALALSFEPVVEFFTDPGAEFGHEGRGVEPFENDPQQLGEHGGVVEVGGDSRIDAWILHLDRDLRPVVQRRPMHLADRCRRHRSLAPHREHLFGPCAQLTLDHCGGQFGGHGRGIGLQARQRLAHGLGKSLVHETRHLAELHEHTFHVAQRLGHLLR